MVSVSQSNDDDHVRSYEVVLVAYRSAALVAHRLEALGPRVPAVVVDNFHGADGLAELVADRPLTRYLDGPGRGFASAANLALRTSSADIVVNVNPDCAPTVPQLDVLVADLADPRTAAVAALVTGPDGRAQFGAGGWEPSARRALVHAVGGHKVFPRAGLWARPTPYEPADLDWLTGTCLALRRSTFLELGGFDESFFVYNEDVDYSRRLTAAGYRQELRTDVLVPHGAAASGDSPGRMLRYRGASLMRDVRRHHGRLESATIATVLSAGSVARAGVAALRRRSGTARSHLSYARGLCFGPPPEPATARG